MNTNSPDQDPSSYNPFIHLPSFKALQDAVFEAVKIGYNEIIDRRTVGIPAALFFRGLIQQTTVELNGHLHTRPASEVRDLIFGYLRCVTVLADKAYDGSKDMPTDDTWNHRSELLEGLYSDLLEIIENAQLYWGDCNVLALKVPDSVFELEWKDKLRDLFWEIEPCLKARKLDKSLSKIVYEPLREMASWLCRMPLTWQRMYYYQQLMQRISKQHKEGKLTNETLLNLLLNINFNTPEVIQLYIQQLKEGLDKERGATNKIIYLKKKESDALLWLLPEYKGMLPDSPSVQEVILPLIQAQLSIQQELKQLEKNNKLTHFSITTSTDTAVTAWLIRIWKEKSLKESPKLEDMFEGFCQIASVNGARDMHPKTLYNACFQIPDAVYYNVDGHLDEWKAFVRKEWQKGKNKPKPPQP
jgi:hypothetical protein